MTGPSDEHNSDEKNQAALQPQPSQSPSQHPPPPPRSTGKAVLLIASCAGAMIVNAASNTSASIALPSVGNDLDIGESELQWIVSAFALSSGCLLLFFGRLADLYGRKKAFMTGAFVQAIFALGCGFAKSGTTIDVLRGFQGCGAAATIPACLGILAHAFPPSKMRAIAFATFAAGAPLGAAIGNTFGAILTQLSDPSWRSVFYLSTGLNILCMIGGYFSMDPDKPSAETDKRVDYPGAFLVTSALVFIIFVLSDGSSAPNGWSTGYIIGLLILGLFLLAVFVAWQAYLEKYSGLYLHGYCLPPPIMKPSMWTRAHGRFAVMQMIAFLTWCSFLSYNIWVQLFYQDYLHLNPVLTMVRLLPMFFTGVVCNVLVALFVGRVDVLYLMVLGTAATACANLFFATVRETQPYWAYGFPSAILSVFGADFVFASGTLFIAKVSLPHEQSLAGGLFQTMTQLGTAFGVSITTTIFNGVRETQSSHLGFTVDSDGNGAPREALLLAYRAAFWGAFAFGITGSILAAIFLRGVGIVGHSRHLPPPKTNVSQEDSQDSVALEEIQGSKSSPA